MFGTLEELKRFCEDEGVDLIDFKMVDVRGRWRHVTLPATRLNEELLKSGIGFDGSNYGFAPVENSDMVFIPDLSTAVIDPFSGGRVLMMTGDAMLIDLPQNRPFDQYPRNVLRAATAFMRDKGIADEMIIGPEFEFHIFEDVRYHAGQSESLLRIRSDETAEDGGTGRLPRDDGYHADLPRDSHYLLRNEMTRLLSDMGVEVKYHHHEVGGSAQEEIETELCDVEHMADQTMTVKYVVRNAAKRAGKTATFLPKPIAGEAGNGMHVHIILKKDGRPVFYDPQGYAQLSKEALLFIGGVLKHAPALCAFTNPSTNSFRRLVPGYEAPVTIGYATANRSAVIRIPAYAKSPDKKRFEVRNPDATCNPYYAYAAILMAGLDGIRNGIDPTKYNWGPFDRNLYELSDAEKAALEHLPKTLYEALDALEADHDFLTCGGVFPQRLIELWQKLLRRETAELERIPTPAEFERYYDL